MIARNTETRDSGPSSKLKKKKRRMTCDLHENMSAVEYTKVFANRFDYKNIY